MAAQDGIFDSPFEAVTIQFLAPDSSPSAEICVRGSDSFGNTGTAVCEQLVITGTPASPAALYLPILIRNYTSP